MTHAPSPISAVARSAALLGAAFLGAAFLGGGLLAAPAQAQDSEAQARTLFERGVGEMNAGRPQIASEYFERSYRLSPRASSACNMALALERSNRSCDAIAWYRQCAALDQSGRFRDHANEQASALGGRCQGGVPNPFVSGPATGGGSGGATGGSGSGSVQIVEGGSTQGSTYQGPGPDHALLVVGLISLALSGGAITAAVLTADASNSEFRMISAPPGTAGAPTILPQEGADADHYRNAETFQNASIGLAVAAGVTGALGLILVIVDLLQPGVFGPSARHGGPHLAVGPRLDGGGFGELALRF